MVWFNLYTRISLSLLTFALPKPWTNQPAAVRCPDVFQCCKCRRIGTASGNWWREYLTSGGHHKMSGLQPHGNRMMSQPVPGQILRESHNEEYIVLSSGDDQLNVVGGLEDWCIMSGTQIYSYIWYNISATLQMQAWYIHITANPHNYTFDLQNTIQSGAP